ncbi:MAG: putative membrane protein [Planctomycetota bacterium]|jgi:putative membrane protein
MYVRRKLRWSIILRFGWRDILWFTLWSIGVTGAYLFAQGHGVNLGIPFAPLGTIGVAVAFYLSFKNSQAYDRFWEARKIWGGVVNESRTLANMVLNFWTTPGVEPGDGRGAEDPSAEVKETQRRIIYRHLAWVNALRVQLRATTMGDRKDHMSHAPDLLLRLDRMFQDEVYGFLEEPERLPMCTKVNTATQLLHRQGQEVRKALAKGSIDLFHESTVHMVLRELYALQGKCERIKSTPFPRQYAYFSSLFVKIFALLLPFALVHEFHMIHQGSAIWIVVPFSVLISWIFQTIESVGDNSEDPFENYINDVPMTAICRTIEIDLRQMLGETDLPSKVEPIGDILM